MRPEDGLRDAFQIVHLDAWCNDCGNCATFCPYHGEPFRDKFTIFDTVDALNASDAPGVHVDGERVWVRWSAGAPVSETTRTHVVEAPDDETDSQRMTREHAPHAAPHPAIHAAPHAAVRALLRRLLGDHTYLFDAAATSGGATPW
jgi:hypothetical protein